MRPCPEFYDNDARRDDVDPRLNTRGERRLRPPTSILPNAMSQNIQRLRATFEAYNRRDFDDALKYAHPDVELHPAISELPDLDSRYRGRDEVKRFFEVITNHWETHVVEPEETIEIPGDRVLAVERWHARGRHGIELDFALTEVYTFRDGLIVRIDGFRERAEAFEAAGLQEPAG
jgi:ketosteroid isomerase-like protein